MNHSVEDAVSDEYLSVNCCGCQHLYGYNTGSSRPNGRRDFHILYITEGICYIRATDHAPETPVPAGSVILYLPGEAQFYRFHAETRSTSYYIHFSGTGCLELLRRMGMLEERVFEIGDSNTLKYLFGKLIDEFRLAAPLYDEVCAGYLLQMIALIGRKLHYKSRGLSVQQNTRIEEICRRMHKSRIKQHLYHCGAHSVDIHSTLGGKMLKTSFKLSGTASAHAPKSTKSILLVIAIENKSSSA